MKNFLAFLITFFTKTIPTWLLEPPAPVASTTTPIDVHANLTQYIESETLTAGPFTGTGGEIFADSNAEAATIAGLIIACSAKYGINVSILASFGCQESKFSTDSFNPNDGNIQPGWSDRQLFANTDWGYAQLSGYVLLSMPQFATSTLDEIKATAFEVEWSLDQMCQMIVENDREMAAAFKADPTLKAACPNGDVRIAACNAYNAGYAGTIASLRSSAPNMAYGKQVVARADNLVALLDA